jgi:hypothetical protein
MKDGTFLRVDVNNLDKLSESDKANIAGVVFWTKEENAEGCPDLSTDEGLKELGYTNGLVISVNAEVSTKWIQNYNRVYVTLDIKKLNGYTNTKKLIEYNNNSTSDPIVSVVKAYSDTDIDNTSGWYVPSSREVVYLYGGTTVDGSNDSFTANYSMLDNFLSNKLSSEFWTSEECDKIVYARTVITSEGSMASKLSRKDKTSRSNVRPVCAF